MDTAIINLILISIMTGVMAITGYLVKQWMNDIKVRVNALEEGQKNMSKEHHEEIDEMKTNYLDRFAYVNENQHKIKEEIIEAINKLTLRVEKQTQFCYLVQKNKEAKNDS